MAVLELDRRHVESRAPVRQLAHDGGALFLAHPAPEGDLLQRAAAADAGVAVGVHDADLHARRLHADFFFDEIARLTFEEGSRPSTPQIHCPMPTSFSRSVPVSTPRPCSM